MLTRLLLVAEAVKAGIASKGGNATIYQCAIIQFFSTSFTNKHYSESLRLSQKTSLLLCTLLRSPTILSPPLIPSMNTTASSSESPRDMETCLPNSRYVISACCSRNRELKIQIQSFWDATGQLWVAGALAGKYAGIFVSTGGLGGGQESTVIASLSTLAHHGIIFVPLGYSRVFPQLNNLDEVHGGIILFIFHLGRTMLFTLFDVQDRPGVLEHLLLPQVPVNPLSSS
jgi:hypothetical protein